VTGVGDDDGVGDGHGDGDGLCKKGLKRSRKVVPYDRCDCLQHLRGLS